jgi:hypothetical protein
MAFDQVTRNRLQKFVGEARKLLSEEFTQQLQNTYGLDPVTGGIAELSTLPSLSPSEQQTAILLRDTLEHYLAASHNASQHKDKALVIAALDRIVREQAFTVLNRLTALRMAEARQFVMESVSHGYQSKGFQLYQRIAGSSLGETGQAYQHYLFSVFDELSLDLAVLFDRYSSQGRLFPREAVLLELLDLINHAELEMLWAEDETVGWIYQYFNSKEERKKMRDESQAPRNSRELAVRNQFFTPRYVVEFLTDNTLGRIWYEMTQGNTALLDSCQYLVRHPNEIFLKAGEKAREQDGRDTTELSQAELLQQTVYIQHRPIKDPRDIKMLDPACGSMHFGLYSFDLFEQIYSEAWDIEAEKGSDIFFSEEGVVPRTSLHEAYPSLETFLSDVPRLIIEHNIHGVDIDPRAAQIAGLSLWLRAQKSWSANAIKPNQRHQIQRSNIVCAEPMPGETQLLKEFTSQIQPRVLGQLVEEIFDKMQLAGEVGTLLKIEEEIQAAIDEAKSQKDEKALEVQGGLFGENKWEVREGKRYYNFGDVSEDFWAQAEQLILTQLELYAESASGEGSGQKRFFAADTAKGFAFVDLCRKRFDVVLMNPPFGAPVTKTKKFMEINYPYIKTDLYGAFVTNGIDRLRRGGLLGALTSRTGFFLSSFEKWRANTFMDKASLDLMVDLGGGVLDAAMVETAAYVISKDPIQDGVPVFFKLSNDVDKAIPLKNKVNNFDRDVFVRKISSFRSFPKSPFCYWLSNKVSNKILLSKKVEPDFGRVVVGVQTDNDFRFVRLWHEVEESRLGASIADSFDGKSWVGFLKGDSSNPFYLDHNLILNWSNDGEEVRAATENAPGGRVNNELDYCKPGISWTKRSAHFVPHIVPKGCIPSVSRYQYIPNDGGTSTDIISMLALLSSEFINFVAKLQTESWNSPVFIPGVIRSLPVPLLKASDFNYIESSMADGVFQSFKLATTQEENRRFKFPLLSLNSDDSSKALLCSENQLRSESVSIVGNCHKDINKVVFSSYDLTDMDVVIPGEVDSNDSFSKKQSYLESSMKKEFVINKEQIFDNMFSWLVGAAFGRWAVKPLFDVVSNVDDLQLFEPYKSKSPGQLGPPSVFSANIIPVDIDDDRGFEIRIKNIFSEMDSGFVESFVSEYSEVESLGYISRLLSRPNLFFQLHLKKYSASKRVAPIYWPIQTESGNYTIWLYYHSVNEQTLFECLNNFVEPKIDSLKKTINSLSVDRTSQDDTQLVIVSGLLSELEDFRKEILRVAEFWKPNLDDGVLVTAAPLWKLFRHNSWRKKLKNTSDELNSGKYDWSHMAHNIFPERVLRKCHEDRSFAIAHGVATAFWEKVEVFTGKTKKLKIIWQPKKLTEAEINTYIQNKIAQG